ncbi:MAG: XRE family transcriptional regulator [Flavobacteriaceae bacterium]
MLSEVLDRIHSRLEAVGLKASTASRRAGLSDSAIRNIERTVQSGRPGAGVSTGTLAALAPVLQTSVAWLLDGTGEEEVVRDDVSVREIDVRAGAGGGGETLLLVEDAGNGITIAAEAVATQWGIPERYLRGELRVNPKGAVVIEVQGDSGYDPNNPGAPGSLFPGDRVIVDTNDRRPSPPGPFLVYDGTGLVVKLVEVARSSEPVSINLSSRNPRYSSYQVSLDEAHIVGRVRGRICAM